MKSLLAEFDILMNWAGVNTIKDIDKSYLSESFPFQLRTHVSTAFVNLADQFK